MIIEGRQNDEDREGEGAEETVFVECNIEEEAWWSKQIVFVDRQTLAEHEDRESYREVASISKVLVTFKVVVTVDGFQ